MKKKKWLLEDNRSFFEEGCLSRGDKYYEEDNFKRILKELKNEQEQGMHYLYHIWKTMCKYIKGAW